MNTIKTISDIRAGLENSFSEIGKSIFGAKPVYHSGPEGKWTIAEQFDHLIRSNFPIAAALKLPITQLAAFGQPEQPSRAFMELKQVYLIGLANGFKATNRFIPKVESLQTPDDAIENWTKIGVDFQKNLTTWKEKDLDKYVLPHPALGNLSIREMLYFTIFHNQHHLEKINEIKNSQNNT
ncbi:MAG: hypothetical protein DHS20C18_35950 [Saprospiraceae bacterium]|nr:MAG: hypothetical protein DHS20C18_35950 [Saprospiraceae bacterium]